MIKTLVELCDLRTGSGSAVCREGTLRARNEYGIEHAVYVHIRCIRTNNISDAMCTISMPIADGNVFAIIFCLFVCVCLSVVYSPALQCHHQTATRNAAGVGGSVSIRSPASQPREQNALKSSTRRRQWRVHAYECTSERRWYYGLCSASAVVVKNIAIITIECVRAKPNIVHRIVLYM